MCSHAYLDCHLTFLGLVAWRSVNKNRLDLAKMAICLPLYLRDFCRVRKPNRPGTLSGAFFDICFRRNLRPRVFGRMYVLDIILDGDLYGATATKPTKAGQIDRHLGTSEYLIHLRAPTSRRGSIQSLSASETCQRLSVRREGTSISGNRFLVAKTIECVLSKSKWGGVAKYALNMNH